MPHDLSALSPLAPALATTVARVASDIALVIDNEGVIRTVAEGTAPLPPSCTGWVGQRWVDTVTSGTRRKIELLLEEAKTGGITRRREVNHPNPGGDDIPLTWSAIRLGEGGPVLAVGRDLRAVAAIQQRLVDVQQDMERHYWNRRQAETRYRLLFQVASDAVLVLDATDLQVTEANAAAAALLGVSGQALSGRAFTDSLPAGARAAVGELLVSARTTGRAGEIRVRPVASLPALDISATPFRASARQHILVRARLDEHGDASGALTPAVSEFVESTPDAVVITDSAGRILMANPAFVALVRQPEEARLTGRPLPAMVGDGGGRWSALVEQARAQGIVARVALDVCPAGALPVAVDATAALMTEGEQACLGFTLRLAERAPALPSPDELLSGLIDLAGQIGQLPLAELLAEAGQRAEKHLIATALLRAGGQPSAAAALLGLTAEALNLRLLHHDLAAGSP